MKRYYCKQVKVLHMTFQSLLLSNIRFENHYIYVKKTNTHNLRHWLFVQLHGFLGLIPLASIIVRDGCGLGVWGMMVPGGGWLDDWTVLLLVVFDWSCEWMQDSHYQQHGSCRKKYLKAVRLMFRVNKHQRCQTTFQVLQPQPRDFWIICGTNINFLYTVDGCKSKDWNEITHIWQSQPILLCFS